MLFLYYWIITFFVVIVSSLLIRSSVVFVNDSWLEFILTLFSLWLVLLIISPLFIMFIDYDSILLSSLLVYSLGYQWSWSFNLNGVFTYSLFNNYSSISYCSFSLFYFISWFNLDFLVWRFFDLLRYYVVICLSLIHNFNCFNVFNTTFTPYFGSEIFKSNNVLIAGSSISFYSFYSSFYFMFSCLFSLFFYFFGLSSYSSITISSFASMFYSSIFSSSMSYSSSPSFETVSINVSFDHFLVPTLSNFTSFDSIFNSLFFSDSFYFSSLFSSLFSYCSFASLFDSSSYLVYFISLNSILLLPCFLGFRFLIFSFDVIHSLGFYSLGFKMDAIPGRINYSFELSTLFKGEHRGFCYELCGTGHSSMLILAISL